MVSVDLVDTRPSTVDLANRPHTPELTSLPLTEHPLATAVRTFISSDQFQGRPVNTRLAYERDLRRLVERFAEHPTIPDGVDIEEFLKELEGQKKSAATIRQNYSAINGCYIWCADETRKLLPPLRMQEGAVNWKQKPKEGPQLTDQQVQDLLSLADYNTRDRNGRDAAIMAVILGTGARLTEIPHLTSASVISQEQGLLFRLAGERKVRYGFISDEPSLDRINYYQEGRSLKDQQDPKAPFFRNKHSTTEEAITRQGVWLVLKRYSEELGVQLTPHMLRRYHLAHKD